MRKFLHTVVILTAAAMLAGCGYRIGFIKHPQLNSIAVAPVVNETAVYNTASDMRFMMNEVIMQDGTFKLSDQRRADAVLYLTVTQAAFANVSDASIEKDEEYKPTEWSAVVSVEYKLIIPGRGEPILKGKVNGEIRFQAATDIESARLSAVRQACYEASKKIVYAIAEGW